MTKVMLERIVEVMPAYDRRDADPKKNYGIHGCALRFVVKGEKGAVQFVLATNWHLPHVTKELAGRSYEPIGGDPHWMERPTPVDVGYHSLEPMFKGQTSMGACRWLDGRDSYYDGSTLQAEKVFELMLEGGSEAVWAELEERYRELFEKEVTDGND